WSSDACSSDLLARRKHLDLAAIANDISDRVLDRFAFCRKADRKACLCAWRNDIQRHSARDRPDIHGRLAKEFVVRKPRMPNVFENVEEFLDRGVALFRICRMRGLSRCLYVQAKRALRPDREVVVSRLAVDQVFAFGGDRMKVRSLRSRRGTLFLHREK